MKRSKANEGMRSRRYQALAALALSILIFAVGETQAAEPFKAWKLGKTPVEAKRLTEQADKDKAINWLVKDRSKVEEYVKTFAKEPVQFAEGLRLAALELAKDAPNFEKNKTDLLEKLTKVSERHFGVNKKVPLHLIAEAILAMDPKDLEKKDLEDLLREILNEDMLKALNLTDEDPTKKKDDDKKEEPKKEDPKKEEPKKEEPKKEDPTAKAELERARAEAERERAARLEAEARAREAVAGRGGSPGGLGGGPGVPFGPAIPASPGAGEVNDAAIQKAAQETCDRIDALKRANENQLLSVVNPLKDALNEQFNQLAALQRNGQQQQQQKNGFDDLLKTLAGQLAGDQGKRRNDNIQPPPQPQQVAARPSNDNDKSKSIFDQPVPQQPQEQPQPPQAPMYIPPLPSADPQLGNIRLALPTSTGRTELRSAMDRVSMNEGRTPVATLLGPNAMVPDLITAKIKVQGDIRATQAELNQAKYRAGELESALEVAQGDARNLLPEKFKRAEKEAKQELEAKKKQYDQLRAQLQQSGNQEQTQQMQPILQQFQAEVNAAESKVKKISDEIEIALENGSAEVKRLAKTRDQLNQTVSKLSEQLGTLKEEESGVSQLLNNAQQLQVQAMQQQQQPPPLRTIYNSGVPRTASTAGGPARYSTQVSRSTNQVSTANPNVRRPGLGAVQ